MCIRATSVTWRRRSLFHSAIARVNADMASNFKPASISAMRRRLVAIALLFILCASLAISQRPRQLTKQSAAMVIPNMLKCRSTTANFCCLILSSCSRASCAEASLLKSSVAQCHATNTAFIRRLAWFLAKTIALTLPNTDFSQESTTKANNCCVIFAITRAACCMARSLLTASPRSVCHKMNISLQIAKPVILQESSTTANF
mmetsp:Transcript_16706/g.42477  ORF Transcript_16706/g.42477 Transcript_16706/m.42477 type:complete len:203 (+) Transcript_16706:562-1170(+)